MNYELEICGLTRELELFPVSDDTAIAAFILFSDVEITKASAAALLERAPEFDVIITAESKGIPLAYEMARQAGIDDYVVARKKTKLYMADVVKTEVKSITSDYIQTLYLGRREQELLKGRRVLIVDDVISTGHSLASLEALVEKVDGKIVGRMCVLAEGDAAKREDITYLEELPLFNTDGSIKE